MIDWSQEQNQPSDADLRKVARLVAHQVDLERAVADAEADLKDLKERLKEVSEGHLPSLLDEIGISDLRMRDGRRVRVEEVLRMSIPKAPEKREKCARWLMAHGLSSLVKEDVIVKFERGQDERIRALQSLLDGSGYSDWSVTENLNTSSVKGAFRERMASGMEVPLELFGGYLQRATVVE